MSPLGALLWAKQRIAVHTLASVRRESKLKVAFVSISSVALWIGLFALARMGFRLFEIFGASLLGDGPLSLSDLVMGRLLAVFALALFAMLIFSNVLIAYTTFYRAREMRFLIHSPISTQQLFLGRFYECVTFSSWASAFLGSPLLLAYGLETGAPAFFYLSLIAFFLPFVVIPAALGTIIAMVLARQLSHWQRGPWLALGGASLLGLFLYFRSRLKIPDFSDVGDLRTIIEAMGHTQSPFLPSYWLSQGMLSAATGDFREAIFHLLLLLANAFMLLWLATWVAEKIFYDGWVALQGSPGKRGANQRGLLSRLDLLFRPWPEPTRSLVVKDLRLFWRDPAQWSQFILFFGLMALYVANVRSSNATGEEVWRAWGTLLNLGASMLILASLTTRFIYPLISLEGRRFWILGLAPITLRQIVQQKFWLSVSTTSVFTVGLAILSAYRLGLTGLQFALSVGCVAATTIALSGLAVGLGSLYPNFEEDNPARIVSGMGGTLNFLLSMVYILLVLAGQAIILLWNHYGERFAPETFQWAVGAVAGWTVVLTVLTCVIPLVLGLRHLEEVEI